VRVHTGERRRSSAVESLRMPWSVIVGGSGVTCCSERAFRIIAAWADRSSAVVFCQRAFPPRTDASCFCSAVNAATSGRAATPSRFARAFSRSSAVKT